MAEPQAEVTEAWTFRARAVVAARREKQATWRAECTAEQTVKKAQAIPRGML